MTSIFNTVTWFSLFILLCSFSSILKAEDSVMEYSDGEIMKILSLANEAEIKAAKEALKKASNKEVKQFAGMMKKEHSKNAKEGHRLAKQEKITMEMSMKNLKQRTEKLATMTNLKVRKGPSFDKAYINSQVEMHQELHADLEQKLIPAAKNEKLKSFLVETKEHVKMHLEKAQEIQNKIGK